jgi:hypothetical protein
VLINRFAFFDRPRGIGVTVIEAQVASGTAGHNQAQLHSKRYVVDLAVGGVYLENRICARSCRPWAE